MGNFSGSASQKTYKECKGSSKCDPTMGTRLWRSSGSVTAFFMPWQSNTRKERRRKYEEASIEPAAGVWHGIAMAKTEGSSAIVIAPQVTGEAKKVMTEVSTQSLKDVVKNTDAALEVQTGGSTVTITVEAKKPEDVKEQVSASQLEDAIVVEVTITSGKKELTTFDGKSWTVTIPVTGSAFVSGETYKVIALRADGSKETVSGTCIKQNGKLSM